MASRDDSSSFIYEKFTQNLRVEKKEVLVVLIVCVYGCILHAILLGMATGKKRKAKDVSGQLKDIHCNDKIELWNIHHVQEH